MKEHELNKCNISARTAEEEFLFSEVAGADKHNIYIGQNTVC